MYEHGYERMPQIMNCLPRNMIFIRKFLLRYSPVSRYIFSDNLLSLTVGQLRHITASLFFV